MNASRAEYNKKAESWYLVRRIKLPASGITLGVTFTTMIGKYFLEFRKIEQHMRTLIESLRDGKPQNIVKFESLTKPNEGEWDWLVDYLKRKSPLVIHEK